MKPPPIHIVWRGQRTGPFTAQQIEEKIKRREISALHHLEVNGARLSVREYLESQQPASASPASGLRLKTAVSAKAEASGPPPRPTVLETPLGGADTDNAGFFSGLSEQVSSVSGLERLQGFSFARLFSEVFSRHTTQEVEERFVVGTRSTTPPLAEVDTRWPTPWVFVRLLLVALVMTAIFYYSLVRFEVFNLVPGLVFTGCFGIPFAVLVFFVEMNALRNVSFYRVLLGLLFGGVLSLAISLFLYERMEFITRWFGASGAGPVEELGKLLAVILVARNWHDKNWTLSGLVLGAAVGTGFSAFESAGYVFTEVAKVIATLSDGTSQLEAFAVEKVLVVRALLSPFTHTIWTAAVAGALWRVRRMHGASWSNLLHWGFLRVFLIVVVLHMAWNSSVLHGLAVRLAGPLGSPLVWGLIGAVGWALVLQLIQAGLKEAREAKARQSALGFAG